MVVEDEYLVARTMDDVDSIVGKCVLVVEDDFLLAREVCNDLKRHGAEVVGPAPTVHYASLIMGRRRLDGAILDINLFGDTVYRLVDVLLARRVPVVLTTACPTERIDTRYGFLDVMPKPLDLGRLRRKVAAFRPLPVRADPIKPPQPVMAPRPQARIDPQTAQDRWSRLLLAAMRRDA